MLLGDLNWVRNRNAPSDNPTVQRWQHLEGQNAGHRTEWDGGRDRANDQRECSHIDRQVAIVGLERVFGIGPGDAKHPGGTEQVEHDNHGREEGHHLVDGHEEVAVAAQTERDGEPEQTHQTQATGNDQVEGDHALDGTLIHVR